MHKIFTGSKIFKNSGGKNTFQTCPCNVKAKLDIGDSEMQPLKQQYHFNRVADNLNIVRGDLALSNSEDDSDTNVRIMAHLERQLLQPPTRSIEVNTDSVRVHTADEAVNTELLIILSPDILTEFSDGLTIVSFNESLRIFVETLNSSIVMSKPSQIGLLKTQLTSSKANQSKLPNSDPENEQLIQIYSRKPTRLSMFVPEAKRKLIKAQILIMPSCSKIKDSQ